MGTDVARALDPRASAVVTSCAGSGKTWLLIGRVMRALLDGARPEEILAITFTRKATGEIRARVREQLRLFEEAGDQELGERLREIGAGDDPATLRRARGLRRKVLLSERDMSIRTFHGWFQVLLRNRPWLPVARPHDEIVENDRLLLEDAWRALMAKTDATRPVGEALLGLLADSDHRPEPIRDALLGLVHGRVLWMLHTRGFPDPVGDAAAAFEEACGVDTGADPPGGLGRDRGFVAAVGRVCDRVALAGTDRQRGIYAREALLPEGDWDEGSLEALEAAFLTGAGSPRKLRGEAFAPLRDDGTLAAVCEGILAAREALDGIRAAAFNRRALRVAVGWLDEYRALKAGRRQADHNDLEVHTWELLTSGGVNALTLQLKMDRTYRHILVDEFQDTSPLQWEILRSWLDASRDAGDDHRPPRVFIVGDPKQSIYRFRGGDPLLLGRARAYLARHYGGQAVSVNVTRRCAPRVVDLANAIFLENPRARSIMRDFEEHAAHFPSRPGRIEVLPVCVREKQEKMREPEPGTRLRNPLLEPPPDREESDGEARMVARRIREIRDSWTVDGEDGRRPCEWDDIMLLYAQSTNIPVFERALRAQGIPCAVSRREPALESLEAADLMALMSFVTNPADDLALAQALRSPVLGVSEAELVSIADPEGRRPRLWRGLAGAGPGTLTARLGFARDRLAAWRERYLSRPLPAHDFLSHVYESGEVLRRYALATPADRRRQVRDNLVRLLHLSLSLGGGRHPQLPLFLRELRRHRRQAAGDARGDIPMEGQVAMLSVHAAKGLERPFVFIVDAMRRQRDFGAGARIGEVVHEWPEESDRPTLVAIAPSRHRPKKVRELAEASRAADLREWFNMLYIAITRARQAVVVSGTASRESPPDPGAMTEWHAFVEEAAGRLGGQRDAHGRLCLGDDLGGGSPGARPAEADAPGPQEAGEPARLAPVGEPGIDITTPQQRRGNLFHSLMALRIIGVDDPAVAAKAVATDDARFGEMWELTGKVFAAPALRKFFAPGAAVNRACEVSVLGADGVTHRIDCLVELGDEMWILDFKTGDVAANLGKYREQLRAYRECVGALRDDKPIRCAVVSERGGLTEV